MNHFKYSLSFSLPSMMQGNSMFSISFLWESKAITNKNESDNTLLLAQHKGRGTSKTIFIHNFL